MYVVYELFHPWCVDPKEHKSVEVFRSRYFLIAWLYCVMCEPDPACSSWSCSISKEGGSTEHLSSANQSTFTNEKTKMAVSDKTLKKLAEASTVSILSQELATENEYLRLTLKSVVKKEVTEAEVKRLHEIEATHPHLKHLVAK